MSSARTWFCLLVLVICIGEVCLACPELGLKDELCFQTIQDVSKFSQIKVTHLLSDEKTGISTNFHSEILQLPKLDREIQGIVAYQKRTVPLGDTIFLPDTFLCHSRWLYSTWIDSSGVYNISAGPPEYPEGTILNIYVRKETHLGPTIYFSRHDTVYIYLQLLEEMPVLIDYGNGESTLFEAGMLQTPQDRVTYGYPDTGAYRISFLFHTECGDAYSEGPVVNDYRWHRAVGKVTKYSTNDIFEGVLNQPMKSSFGSRLFYSRETTTNVDGDYLFPKQFEGDTAVIQPVPNLHDIQGLDIADLLLINRHLSQGASLLGPYEILAADINGDEIVNNADQDYLMRLLQESDLGFPDTSSSWIYWPQTYEFPDIDSPFGHPDRIPLPPVYADTFGLDFFGVKRGDLSTFQTIDTSLTGPDTLFFRLDNDPLNIGDTVTVDFHSRNFTDLVGFQFQLDFDTNALHFQGVDVGAVPGLTEDNFGLTAVDQGKIRVTWLDFLGQSHSLVEEEVAFGLRFVAEEGIIDRGEHLSINEDQLGAKAFDANLLEAPVRLLIDPINCADTTYTTAIACQVDAPSETIAVFTDPLGCDSVVITAISIEVDTSYQQLYQCDSTLTVKDTVYSNSVVRLSNGCDEILVTETILLPSDTTYLQASSCNPQDTGLVLTTLVNAFGCDSILITQTSLVLDTTYLTTFVCDQSLVGALSSVQAEADGCQFVQLETRMYDSLDYQWNIIPDTCRFGVGSAQFISNNANYSYSFEWDGPSANIDPAQLFSGVYNVTISATSISNGTSCLHTERITIGNIGDLAEISYTYTNDGLSYTFNGSVENANSFYWDFGDSTTSTELNPMHTYQDPGTYLVCLVADNNCNTTQDCQAVQTPAWYNIAGKLETSPLQTAVVPVVADVGLTFDSQDLSMSTDMNGAYVFEDQFEGLAYTVTPQKEENILNGLDVADVIRLSQYLNGNRTLVSPDQILAADVDCNEVLAMEDVLALQAFLLGDNDEFADGCSNWIFWPQAYNFANPETPFGHPNSIQYEDLSGDISDANFFGLKRGDLGGNADAARGGAPPDSLFFRLKNGFVAASETVQLDFRLENFEQVVGFQMELKYDTAALDFQEITFGELEALDSEHLGLSKVDEGIIRIVWLDILGNDYTLADGSLAFGVRFQAKQDIQDRADHIAIDSRELAAVFFNAELVEGPVALKFDIINSLDGLNDLPFSLFQNQPNPFNQHTIIPFELPKSSQASLRIYNQLGQLVWKKTARYPSGRSSEAVSLLAPGLYYYSLDTKWGRATKKMLLTSP